MKESFEYSTVRGLPGGPNEEITYVTGVFSIEGYKRNSPDVNNPYNIIPSADITMKGVDFPVRGYGNNGIVQDMIPGKENYNYGDADYVVEVPMAKSGGEGRCWPGYKPVSGKLAYTSGSCEKAQDGTEIQPIELDEVIVKAYNLNKLTEDEKKLYNIFRTGLARLQMIDNPDYNPNWKDNPSENIGIVRREKIPMKDEDGKSVKVKDFVPNLKVYKNIDGDNVEFDVSFEDALRLYREAGSPTISNKPGLMARFMPEKYNVNKESGNFRAHADPVFNKIYIPEGSGPNYFKPFLAEIAHIHPDYNFLPTLSGTLDRIKRSYQESDFIIPGPGFIPLPTKIADDSNYKSKKDFEYKTHQIAEKNIADAYFKRKEKGGQVKEMFSTYANYINGKDKSQNAKKAFDKLNRIYYKDAKKSGMGVANFIATYIIPNS